MRWLQADRVPSRWRKFWRSVASVSRSRECVVESEARCQILAHAQASETRPVLWTVVAPHAQPQGRSFTGACATSVIGQRSLAGAASAEHAWPTRILFSQREWWVGTWLGRRESHEALAVQP